MAKTKTKTRSRKPANVDLPGIEGNGVAPVRIVAIDRLARSYVSDRDSRIAALSSEVAAKQKLIAAMHAHADEIRLPDGRLAYTWDDSTIFLVPGKEKLSVVPLHDTSEEAE